MKRMYFRCIVVAVLAVLPQSIYAQVSSGFTAQAAILSPVGIASMQDYAGSEPSTLKIAAVRNEHECRPVDAPVLYESTYRLSGPAYTCYGVCSKGVYIAARRFTISGLSPDVYGSGSAWLSASGDASAMVSLSLPAPKTIGPGMLILSTIICYD